MNVSARAVRRGETEAPARPSLPARTLAPRRWPYVAGLAPRVEESLARMLARAPALALVAVAGLVSAIIYALFVWAFPITVWWAHPHAGQDPTAINDLGRLTHYSPLAAAGFVAAIVALFACQVLALAAIGRREEQVSPALRRVAVAFPLLFALILIWMQPVTTTDLYGYVARGYLYAYQHLNPMTKPAFLLPGSLLVSRPAAPYGPAWLLLCGAFAVLAGQNLLVNLLLFKVVGAGGVAVAIWLVGVLAGRLAPHRATRIVTFFAWNPLLLFEAVGNGHNDIVMMICVLGALVLMLDRRARAAFALIVLGALIKYAAVVLVPLWLVYELAQRQRESTRQVVADATAVARERAPAMQGTHHPARGAKRSPTGATGSSPPPPAAGSHAVFGDARSAVVVGARSLLLTLQDIDQRAALELIGSVAIIGAMLVIAFYAPFWDGAATFAGLGQQLRPLYYNGSLAQFVAAPLQLLVDPSHYAALDKTVRLAFYAGFAAYASIQVHRLWMRGSEVTLAEVITASAKIMFAALLLIAFWYQPWYVIWLLPLAALANESFVRRQAVILSAGSLLTYAVGNFLFVHESGIGQALFVQFFEVLVAFVPLLLLRLSPTERTWPSIVRNYVALAGEGLQRRPYLWDRAMLALILVVAVLLRLLRLGPLFVAIDTDGGSQVLQQVGGDLRLTLTDPRGLEGPFALLQHVMVVIFGPTPFAILLPSAIIGSITVWLIYLLTVTVLSDGSAIRARAVGLLAALLAATSEWHVSLSRSGVQVVLLPFLMCTAIYCLLLALRMSPEPMAPSASESRGRARNLRGRRRAEPAPLVDPPRARRRVLLFACSGLATGLASDLAMGLWLLPLLVVALLLAARWRRPQWYRRSRAGLISLALCSVVSGLPGTWHFYLGPYIGFPAGSAVLARSSPTEPVPTSLREYVGQVTGNAGAALHALAAQDFSAGWPSTGGTPLLLVAVWPFFYLGVALILWRWRSLSSLTLLLLLALPLIASVAVGTQSGIVQAASVLPAACIVPALAIFETARVLGRLLAAVDRAHGARVFATPERIGRLLFMVFLVVCALRTFYWYFQATLPTTPPNSTIAS
jgi:hypothetical protein